MRNNGTLKDPSIFKRICPMKPQSKLTRVTFRPDSRIWVRNNRLLQWSTRYSMGRRGYFHFIVWDPEILTAFILVNNADFSYKPNSNVGDFDESTKSWSGNIGMVIKAHILYNP